MKGNQSVFLTELLNYMFLNIQQAKVLMEKEDERE